MKDYIINTPSDFNLKETLECGQCFHFNMIDENEYVLTAYGHMLHIRQDDKNLIFYDTDDRTYNELWREYFDIDRNYARIKEELLAKDDKLEEAISAMSGVRILNQEFFETLISFIISQNKQIPHIKKIVSDISAKFGTYKGTYGGVDMYTFPSLDQLANASEEDFKELKTGFRAPYIMDAIRRNREGQFDKNELKSMDYESCINDNKRCWREGCQLRKPFRTWKERSISC